jgi:aspartyl-tRNA(Asn)/glutamyl-tRNA(Gln) amidotransferase subunit B
METRTFDAAKGITIGMRSKEMAHDYRYFPEPDLQPITVSEAMKEAIRKDHATAAARAARQVHATVRLERYDAGILTDDKETALYYEAVIAPAPGGNYKGAPTG